MSNMTEKQMDEIVEQIKEPILELDQIDAELLMLHAAFEVSCMNAAWHKRSLQEQKEHLRICFERFLEGSPDIVKLLNRRF